MRIRPETRADWAVCDRVHGEAFGGPDEAALVRRLRDNGLVRIALIAEAETPVGHIVFSDLPVEVEGRAVAALALAPVAVCAACQRKGVGGALIRAGLDEAREAGFEAVIVLGHPGYYPRFGFSAALAEGLAAPFAGPAFMALELRGAPLRGKTGRVTYPAAFGVG